ncbi:uncharacterized protein K02A2.6-like [Anopheles arabiensis]|uniref:uncharacterized protein K02A2.6-like n=1 Tax=Anopheles arabiensis TaxID=7173 RepID=UPI001AAD0503|nr:uncharacterized protein K02A2.6-like [Anopheles arabiensis]
MNTGEDGAPDFSMEVDQRRASLLRASAFALSQHLLPPTSEGQASMVQPPSQNAASQPSPAAVPAPTTDSAMMMQMMQEQMQQQQQLISRMLQQPQSQVTNQQSQAFPTQVIAPSNPELIIEALSGSITEFRYEAESEITFDTWFARYEDLFAQDASRLDDAAKVRLLVRKLGPAEHARYASFILPSVPREIPFDETVKKLKALFGRAETLVSKRYKCLQLTKSRTEDFVSFVCRVNRSCVNFQLSAMSEEQFKCLILVCGLKDDADADVRTRLLSRIEERTDFTLEQLSAECERISSLKVDSAMIATQAEEQILALRSRSNAQQQASKWKQRKQYQHTRNSDNATDCVPRRMYTFSSSQITVLCFFPKRPVAYAMRATVDKELDRLEDLGVITPVDYSDWAAPIVVVRKQNGSVRICGDYSTGLNAALQSYEYPLPLPEDIFAKLAQCKYFSKIDLTDAFLQVKIKEEYRPLLTINTHRGLYHYNRLPPGIKIAPAAFQQLIDAMLSGLKCTSGYMDDVVVGGKTESEHDENLLNLFRRIKEYGFTIRAEKCSFKMPRIEYLGFVIDRQGLRPNPAKIDAILKMPAPTNVSEVRSFLGTVNYYGKFVPKMRELRYPLDALLKNDTKFVWTRECANAFNRFKDLLASDLLLTHYDPNAEIVVSADASSVGLGATISHRYADGSLKVVQHASRALTKAEANYSQIDREGLAIIFAVKKFHKMLFGRHFRLQTDHRPLLRIFGSHKGIPVYTPNRLQRFALQLLMYDFTIEYVQTDKFGNADVLSRLIYEHAKPDPEYVIASAELENDVSSIASYCINIFPLNFRDVAKATESDPVLKKVYGYIMEGWPQNVAYAAELACFYHRSEALTTVRGCILFGERVVKAAAALLEATT